jgi:signal transduction histidine kinase
MTFTIKNFLLTLRYATIFSAMVFVWLLLGMLYQDHFFKPFDRLVPVLMPWKAYDEIPEGATTESLIALMEDQLAVSNKAAVYSFATMAGSFTMLCIYLTFVYQQQQRRSRENELFLLKNREVERRNEFIRYISATISHEFKNNLGRIKRRIDLLSGLPEDAKKRIDDNMDKLFADIEIFKKISDERETALIKFEKVELRALLTEMSEQFSDFAEVSMTSEVASSSIFASQPLLKTVFENLFDNAIKYKKPEQQRARISIACAQDIDQKRRYLSLLFRDEGIGMDEEEADRCFYKGKGTREGWGQGLYFVKYVIGLHAGKIRVGKEYTAPGTGTEIIINLPFVEEALDA